MTGNTPTAGWYDDPTDARLMRWWDGTAWSEHVAPHPTPPSGPVASAVSEAVAAGDPEATPGWYVADGGADTPSQRATDAVMHVSAGSAVSPPRSRRELRLRESAASSESAPSVGSPAVEVAAPPAVVPPAVEPVTEAPTIAPPAATAVDTESIQRVFHPSPEPVAFGARTFAPPSDPTPGADAAPDPLMWSTPRFAPTPASASFPDAPRLAPPFSREATDAGAASAAGDSAAAPGTATASDFARPGDGPGWNAPGSFAMPSSAAELASADYAPMQRASAAVSLRATRAGTPGAWFVALSPLLGAAAVFGLAFAAEWSLRTGSLAAVWADPLTALAIVGGALVVLALLIVLGVIADRRQLESLGHQRRASGWWVLLGTFPYLLARTVTTRKESGRGAAPLVAHVLIGLSVTTALTVAPFLVPREASVAQMRAAESAISAGLAAEGVPLTVLCPDTADARIGSGFVCMAYDETGEVVGLVTTRWTGVDGSVAYSLDVGSASG